MLMRALVTGATGTIGTRLVQELGRETVVLSRDPARAAKALGVRALGWDGRSALDPAAFDGIDAVFHLAGEPVGEGRWTEEKKRRIEESRTAGTHALVSSMARAKVKPRVLVSASAVGYYGSRGDELLTESSPAGEGFLASVCRAWEDEAAAAANDGVRVASLRIGIVLARDGGALDKMLPLFRSGLAGRLGSGKQWMPWIHVDDVVGVLLHAAKDERVRGPMNGAAPELVTNAEFTRALARAVHRPALFAAPELALKLALGEMAKVVLASQRVVPERALATGYRFAYPSLAPALLAVVGRPARQHAEAHP
jgi:uncharacterized protein